MVVVVVVVVVVVSRRKLQTSCTAQLETCTTFAVYLYTESESQTQSTTPLHATRCGERLLRRATF